MKLKYLLIAIWVVVATIGTYSYAKPAEASGSFNISYAGKPGPLFSETNMAPTQSVVKQITVKNNTKNKEKFYLELEKLVGKPDKKLAKVLVMKISRGSDIFYEDIITDMPGDNIYIEKIPAGKEYTYDFRVTMKNVGNAYQGKQIKFDLVLSGQQQEVKGDDHHDGWWDGCGKYIAKYFR